ncbi:MAG: hypothetical protein HUJ95_06355 [Bacteroidales bacterium]|nr:hypothetical protein [Bacteroidales bacterium]
MAKKIKISRNEGYDWQYCSLGGTVRVNITSGEDIAHLGELDQKLWTVLSMPVNNLEFDKKTLTYLDTDNDGKVKVHEVVDAANYLSACLKNKDSILEAKDSVSIDEINDQTPEGQALAAAVKEVLNDLPDANGTINIASCGASMEALNAKLAEIAAAAQAEVAKEDIRPYGDDTDAAIAAADAIAAKVADYFMRCRLIAFNSSCKDALGVSSEQIAAIGAKDLSTCEADIAAYPLTQPADNGLLPLDVNIVNPAWQASFSAIKAAALDKDFAGADAISQSQWNSVLDRLAAYKSAKAAHATVGTDGFDVQTSAKQAAIMLVDRFLTIYQNFAQLLRNYVMFSDFYAKDTLAVFQAGQLYIDQRCCNLCIRVEDMGKHADMAGLSNMYLIYCECVSKSTGKTMNIVAALTQGDVDNFRVGQNGIFYDRTGADWDATITKLVDNPTSVRQAFWSPYKKFARWCGDKIKKLTADKESKSLDNLANVADKGVDKAAPAQAFDIAKFAGIFAAIGLALGAIGGFITTTFGAFFKLGWYMPLGFVGLLLVISGPSMLMAAFKLRKRNLGPILNANGWAINAKVIVNIPFGSTLTSVAKYPLLNLQDPYAEKKMPCFVKWLIGILVVIVLGAGTYGVLILKKVVKNPFAKEKVEQVEAAPAPADEVAPVEEAAPAEETPAE